MAGFSTNRLEIERKVRASMKNFERRFAEGIRGLIIDADGFIKSLTPVHTGQTVRNYIWTAGEPFYGVFDAIDTGDPGRTNSMPLGPEPRRAANEAAAAESLHGLDFGNPFQTFVLTNNAPAVGGLEHGLLPGPPLQSRSPNGMFGLTHEYVMTRLRTQGIAR